MRNGTVVDVVKRTIVEFSLDSRLAAPAASESLRVCTIVGRGVLLMSKSTQTHGKRTRIESMQERSLSRMYMYVHFPIPKTTTWARTVLRGMH